ncbi:hypothetical protein C8F04DRAFT_1094133 [Mycena alexandri]|uniref:MYND-type domain-containing protein n=1 Tax=Mycena alexandri TaxID=1745969 RepID=A0AAD6T3L7_9AGAR|nr:hypothetical protein C8F04DRAFT_1094133 [Mycena alexandri]
MQGERVPPLHARIGLACYKCFKDEDIRLSRCSGCHRISYCSSECQKLDWRQHKAMCKALSGIEKNNPMAVATLFFSLPSEPTTDLNVLHNMTETHAANILGFCERSLQRQPNVLERNIVGWEPRCMVCTRTDQLIRMEAAKNGTTSEVPKKLIPCSRCDLSFCCSPAHWEAARALHHGPSCEDGHDGLSHCDMNREVRADLKFAEVMAGAHDESGQFRWAPERLKSSWSSLVGLSWEGEFGDEMRRSVGVPQERPMGPWVRAASEHLSMPMSILYALEKLNDDDAWTKKHTLTIHILGGTMTEITAAPMLEEILHRLSEVKTLKLVLCGPEMEGNHIPRLIPLETCPDCTRLGRKRIHEHVSDTYHGYVKNKGTKFEKPDLCIAFNSGASQASMHSWPATFKILVDRKIPSLFTAYNREEAEGEAALLRKAGATLLPALGPIKNPWGSIKVIPEPNKIYGFYAANGWLAGGFKQ